VRGGKLQLGGLPRYGVVVIGLMGEEREHWRALFEGLEVMRFGVVGREYGKMIRAPQLRTYPLATVS